MKNKIGKIVELLIDWDDEKVRRTGGRYYVTCRISSDWNFMASNLVNMRILR